MIGVVAKLTIADGKHAEFEALAKDLMAKVKANEPGTLPYQLYKSQKEEGVYIFMEEYAYKEALAAHGKTPYFAEAGPKLGPLLAGAPDIQYFDMDE